MNALSPTHLELISKSKTNTYKHTYKETDAHSQTLLQRAPQENPSQLLNFRHDQVNTFALDPLVCVCTQTHTHTHQELCNYYNSSCTETHFPLTTYGKRNKCAQTQLSDGKTIRSQIYFDPLHCGDRNI